MATLQRNEAIATDRKTNQYVVVSSDWFSVNGCEPAPVPEDLRGQAPKAIARQLLVKLLKTQ